MDRELTSFLCLFHNQDHAEAAVDALEKAGFNRSSITSVGRKADGAELASVQQELAELGAPERDLQHLQEGVAQGGVVLGVDAAEERSDEIERIFEKYSARKIDEVDQTTPYGAVPAVAPVLAPIVPKTDPADVVIPVVAEELVVGKREVDRGGVRVYRHVVEEPVSESVSLHEEHGVMDRRPVNRAVTQADLQTGGEVIELTETDQVPVVQKVARVVEEVRLGVVGSDRTETVQDTVRHTELDVEPLDETAGTTSAVTGTKPTLK